MDEPPLHLTISNLIPDHMESYTTRLQSQKAVFTIKKSICVWTAVMQLSHSYTIPQVYATAVDVSPQRPGFDPFRICGK
jgi:hypothetical protein